jgi:hypothetical protein
MPLQPDVLPVTLRYAWTHRPCGSTVAPACLSFLAVCFPVPSVDPVTSTTYQSSRGVAVGKQRCLLLPFLFHSPFKSERNACGLVIVFALCCMLSLARSVLVRQLGIGTFLELKMVGFGRGQATPSAQ